MTERKKGQRLRCPFADSGRSYDLRVAGAFLLPCLADVAQLAGARPLLTGVELALGDARRPVRAVGAPVPGVSVVTLHIRGHFGSFRGTSGAVEFRCPPGCSDACVTRFGRKIRRHVRTVGARIGSTSACPPRSASRSRRVRRGGCIVWARSGVPTLCLAAATNGRGLGGIARRNEVVVLSDPASGCRRCCRDRSTPEPWIAPADPRG